MNNVTYQQISESLPTNLLAPIDRTSFVPKTVAQKEFSETGVVHLKKFIPQNLLTAYAKLREKQDIAQGWAMECPYMHYKEIQDICLYQPLAVLMRDLIGQPMGLHLNLTGWKSTERSWHSDSYLNPPHVGTNYIAVWIAIDNIHPDSGPFQYVPGSHKWPVVRREKIFQVAGKELIKDPLWPTKTQEWVSRCCMEEAHRRGGKVADYLPEAGDVLIWHSSLIHRGSPPKDPSLLRKSLIAHYSGIHSRPDMPKAIQSEFGGFYFPINQPLPKGSVEATCSL